MRTGHFVPLLACKKGYSNNVSGHVQLPLKAMQLLADAGHDVHLFTNAPTVDRPDLPDMLPSNITIHYVADGRKRTKVVEGVGGQGKGISFCALRKQIKQIKAIVKKENIELFHSYGYGRTATLAVMLGLFGLRIPKVVTLFGLPPKTSIKEKLIRTFWKSLHLISATTYVKELCAASNLQATVICQGSVRDLIAELGSEAKKPTKRVLFWRDPTRDNGADLCMEAFNTLAPKYPEVTFEMAIRPHWNEIDGIDELEQQHINVHIHHFPYEAGVNLADLVTGSCCIVLPFREHSIHPQLAIAESLSAGVPVVTSDIGSAAELVQDGKSGYLVPVDDAIATTAAIDTLLAKPEKAIEMGLYASKFMREVWGWDHYVEEVCQVYETAT